MAKLSKSSSEIERGGEKSVKENPEALKISSLEKSSPQPASNFINQGMTFLSPVDGGKDFLL